MIRRFGSFACLAALLAVGCSSPQRISPLDLASQPVVSNTPVDSEATQGIAQESQSPSGGDDSSGGDVQTVSTVQHEVVQTASLKPGSASTDARGPAARYIAQRVPPATPSVPAEPSTEASQRELQPGVGEIYTPPPAIPPVPPGLEAIERAGQQLPPGTPVTLEMLEAWACQYNPTLEQAEANVQGELGRAVQAGLWPNPQLRFRNLLGGLTTGAGETTWGVFTGGTVQQKFVTADKLDLQRAHFLQRSTTAQWVALAQEWRVLNDIRIHYFQTLAAQATVNVRKEMLQNAEDGVVTSREAYNIGVLGREQLHLANVVLQQSRLELQVAENLYRQSFQMLMTLTGTDLPLTPVDGDLEHGLDPIQWDVALQWLLVQAPQLNISTSNLRADEILLKREIVDVVPNLTVEAGAGLHDPKDETVGFVKAFAEVPIWDWNQGNIRTAEANVHRQRAEIRRTQLQLENELATVYQAYLTAYQHSHNYQEVILPEARRRYEVLLDAYEDDRAQWLRVLEVQREYYLLRLAYIEQLVAWRTNEVLIAGFLLHGGLAPAPNPMGPGFTPPVATFSLSPGR